MYYTYVLRCGDGKWYIGSTGNLRRRIVEHQASRVPATASRLPVTLEYYEAGRSEVSARLREKQLKSGFGRAYLDDASVSFGLKRKIPPHSIVTFFCHT
jgi:putative endonuclease